MMKHLTLSCLLFAAVKLAAQTPTTPLTRSKSTTFARHTQYFSLQYLGLSIHPGGGSMPQYYPLKIDAKAWIVAQIGLVANYDYQLNRRFFVRSAAGFYSDCAFQPSGFLHLGIRFTALEFGRHAFSIGLGPTFMFRKDWHQFKEYKTDAIFGDRVSGDWQYRFMPYGGELDYFYRLNDRFQIHYSMIPGYPSVITSKLGVRWKLF